MSISEQFVEIFIIPFAIACIAWTVTHEEIFKEPRTYCIERSRKSKQLLTRKFFYLFTCEYCFSHYVTALFLIITGYQLLYPDWRGYLLAGFVWIWIANIYMSLFGLLRQNLKKDRIEASIKDIEFKEIKEEAEDTVDKNQMPPF